MLSSHNSAASTPSFGLNAGVAIPTNLSKSYSVRDLLKIGGGGPEDLFNMEMRQFPEAV